jgi:hypothetical protein
MWYTETSRTLAREWWYTWTASHLIGEPLGMNDLKERAAEAVGVITVRNEPQGKKARTIIEVTCTALGNEEIAACL